MNRSQYNTIMNRLDQIDTNVESNFNAGSAVHGWDEGVKFMAGEILRVIDSGSSLEEVKDFAQNFYDRKYRELNDG